MKPFTLAIAETGQEVWPGIPIKSHKSMALFLPDGRRVMATSISLANVLVNPLGRIEDHVHPEIVHPKVMFKEGEQAWISLKDATATPNIKSVLIYVSAVLPHGWTCTYEHIPSQSPDAIVWFHPLQTNESEATSTTSGLFSLRLGHLCRFVVSGPNGEIYPVTIVGSEMTGNVLLSLPL